MNVTVDTVDTVRFHPSGGQEAQRALDNGTVSKYFTWTSETKSSSWVSVTLYKSPYSPGDDWQEDGGRFQVPSVFEEDCIVMYL